MTGHLQPVKPPRRPRRLNSRKEIDAWIAERRAVLTQLQAQQRPLVDADDRRAA